MSNKLLSWIHCNACYFYYDDSDRFYLVNCMHIFCYNCLDKLVIANGNKCCICKKAVRYKRIDDTLDEKLKAVLDPDPSKGLDSVVRAVEMSTRQMMHLHTGIERAEKVEREYTKMEAALDAEEVRIKAMTAKVVAQNHTLERMIAAENKKRLQQVPMRGSQRPSIISASQNIRFGSAMGPPRLPAPLSANTMRSVGLAGPNRQRPNVTRLSRITKERGLY